MRPIKIRKRQSFRLASDLVYLKICLAVLAHGTHLGGLGTHHDMTADAARRVVDDDDREESGLLD